MRNSGSVWTTIVAPTSHKPTKLLTDFAAYATERADKQGKIPVTNKFVAETNLTCPESGFVEKLSMLLDA